MDDKLYDGVPAHVLDDQNSLGEYAAFLTAERGLTTFGMNPLDRADRPGELRKAVIGPQLTEQVRIRILEGIRKGNYPWRAAARAGIPVPRWKEWMKQGAAGVEPFATFLTECMVAEADKEDELLSQLDARTFLERRFSCPSLAESPEYVGARWRKQTNIELNNTNDPSQLDLRVLKPEDRAKYLAALAQAAEKAAVEERQRRDALLGDKPVELPEWAEGTFDYETE